MGRFESIERGLTLVFENFDCCDGQLGAIDGLARDAAGAPVLVLLAMAEDPLLVARALAAVDFLQRVGEALGPSVPEGAFCVGTRGRVVVIAIDRNTVACETLARLAMPGLQVCRLEPFRVAGSERFAVRWSPAEPSTPPSAAGGEPAAAFAVPPHLQATWSGLHQLCLRIDPGIRIDGDRFRRRITWNGQALAEVRLADGAMHGMLAEGATSAQATVALATAGDVRSFADQLLRGYARLAGFAQRAPAAGPDVPAAREATLHAAAGSSLAGLGGFARSPGGSLRTVAAESRLTPEEYSALDAPASAAGVEAGGAATTDDPARGVPAASSWSFPGRSN